MAVSLAVMGSGSMDVWSARNYIARELRHLEKMKVGLALRVGSFERRGFGPIHTLIPEVPATIAVLERYIDRRLKELAMSWAGDPQQTFVERTPGLGPATLWFLSLVGRPLHEFTSLRWFRARIGLNPKNVGRRKGERCADPFLKAFALVRLAEPCIDANGPTTKRPNRVKSPYRAVYDRCRAELEERHPQPVLDCETCQQALGESAKLRAGRQQTRERKSVAYDCSHYGGRHWVAGHQYAYARRRVAVAITNDLWRIARGEEPTHGAPPAAVCL